MPNNLTVLRSERGLSLQALAQLAEINTSTLWRIEKEITRPSAGTAKALANALETSVDALFGEEASV